ncbi:MAG: FkbM family methyltransferase [Candidatus Paceibacterota bacterium]|jgi:FkbM family methyltransferase
MKEFLKKIHLFGLFKKIQWLFNELTRPRYRATPLAGGLERIGTNYGGWMIPRGLFNQSSICYLAGAGEDISLDVGIVEKYGSQAFIFDPTPGAVAHFKDLIEKTERGEKMPINNSSTEFYSLSRKNIPLLHFQDLGLWNKADTMKLYCPINPDWKTAHSLTNLQKTSDYVLVKTDRLSNIMKNLGHKKIDLLKIDIEGSEYRVIDSIVEDNLDIKCICVEFDEVGYHLDMFYFFRIYRAIKQLLRQGYKIINITPHYNVTFLRKDLIYETEGSSGEDKKLS